MACTRWIPVSLAAAVLAALWTPTLAAASCAVPGYEVSPATVAPGGELTVTGTGWGTACNDVGPLPEGVRILGAPATGIELSVQQLGRTWLVGTVDADDEYRFGTTVTVPIDAEPGPAKVVTSGYSLSPDITITDTVTAGATVTSTTGTAGTADPVATTRPVVITHPAETTAVPASAAGGGSRSIDLVAVVVGGAAGVAVLAIAAAVLTRRRR